MPTRMSSKRDSYEIFECILKVARKGASRTRIMYISNLSFDLLEKYTKALMKRGLIQPDGAHRCRYFTTEKGRRFIDVFKELKKIAS